MPRSEAATSKAQRVRVEVFSKIRAMFFPVSIRWEMPLFFCAFSVAATFRKWVISAGVKSSSLRKYF